MDFYSNAAAAAVVVVVVVVVDTIVTVKLLKNPIFTLSSQNRAVSVLPKN